MLANVGRHPLVEKLPQDHSDINQIHTERIELIRKTWAKHFIIHWEKNPFKSIMLKVNQNYIQIYFMRLPDTIFIKF